MAINEQEFPLYPELMEEGKKEAQELINQFKDKMEKAAKEVLSNLYCDVAFYIESDSWTNYRHHIMEGFKNYSNRKIQGEYDFKEIRQAIFKEYREDIIKDLNQDMVLEIESLKKEIAQMREGVI